MSTPATVTGVTPDSAPPPKGIDFDYRRYDLDLTREIR